MAQRKLILVTGKGGIGKTLFSAALGQMVADSGLRVLLVENAATDQIAPLFGFPPVGHKTTQVAPRMDCINLNIDDNFRDYIVKHLGQRRLFDKVLSHRVVQSFISMIPGLGELMILGRFFYECELAPDPRYDVVIFDGPASGHFMSLMTTPEAVLASNLGGPLRRETERVDAFLRDPAKVGMVYLATPEELVVSETLDFLPRLYSKAPATLSALVLNKFPMWPREALSGMDLGPAGQYIHRQEEVANQALRILQEGLRQGPPGLSTLPLWLLPDLGALEEPIRPDLWQMLLGGALGPKGERGLLWNQ